MHAAIAILSPRPEHVDDDPAFTATVEVGMHRTPRGLSCASWRDLDGEWPVGLPRRESRDASAAAQPGILGIGGRDPARAARRDDLLSTARRTQVGAPGPVGESATLPRPPSTPGLRAAA